jgi:predicted TIM-barrel fold metal-dependent hydrolase
LARIGVDGHVRDEDVTKLCQLARHPHTHVKVSAFYALGSKMPPYDDLVPMIRRVFDGFGPERLMWASDSPYQLAAPNSYQASLDLVQRLDFLSESDRDWLLRKTAEKVYFYA